MRSPYSSRKTIIQDRVLEFLKHFQDSFLNRDIFYHEQAVFLLWSYSKSFAGWQTLEPSLGVTDLALGWGLSPRC